MQDAKILLLDIETAPAEAFVWRRWKENIRPQQVISESYVMCAVGKQLGSSEFLTSALPDHPLWGTDRFDDRAVVEQVWRWLDWADIVIAHNGDRFDLPTLNSRFILHGLTPPSPYKTIDTLSVAKKVGRFPYNSLDALCEHLGLGRKKETGFQLWKDCRAGDPEAWRIMLEYCEHDVLLLEKLYLRLRPWVASHPNLGLHMTPLKSTCARCGSTDLQRRGTTKNLANVFQRVQCRSCGGWGRIRLASAPREDKKNITAPE